jgi:hypothetical protein
LRRRLPNRFANPPENFQADDAKPVSISQAKAGHSSNALCCKIRSKSAPPPALDADSKMSYPVPQKVGFSAAIQRSSSVSPPRLTGRTFGCGTTE